MDRPYTPSRPGMVQPESEQGVFEPDKMREELKGMAPADLEPAPMPRRPMPRRPMPAKKMPPMKKAGGGNVSGYAKGGSVTRADGCAQRGHTKGRMV